MSFLDNDVPYYIVWVIRVEVVSKKKDVSYS